MSVENVRKITTDVVTDVATVGAWPEEVSVAIHTLDGNLTIEQAKGLVNLIEAAIEDSAYLEFIEVKGDFHLVDHRDEKVEA